MTLEFRSGFADSGQRAAYLEGLTHCFPGWGDERRFGWCFERHVGGLLPDLMWLADASGRAVAGIALVYRNAHVNGERSVRIAMYCGAWTLPDARGRGAYAHLIERGQLLAAQREALAIVSFVTADNASCRGLARRGALMVPSCYCRSPRAIAGSRSVARVVATASVDGERFAAPGGTTFLTYTAAEWKGQFLERPGIIEAVGDEDRWTAILERTPDFDRVLALAGPLAARLEAIDVLTGRAFAAGRRLFVFERDPGMIAALDARGFERTDGYIAVLPAAGGAEACPSNWFIQNGDRM